MNSAVGIHVLTGSGRLVAPAGRIRAQLRAASTAPIEQLALDGGSIDVVVRDDPRMVIPEVGPGGYAAPDGHTVFLALDPDHELFEWALEREVFRMLSHELHHVARRRGSARGDYDNPRYNHWAWFFGSDACEIPRWAGYSLGFALIGDYLERHPGSSAAALATVPSETFRRS